MADGSHVLLDQEAKNIKEMVLVVPDNQVFAFRSIASFALKVRYGYHCAAGP